VFICSYEKLENCPRMDNYYHYDKDLSNMNMVYVECMCEKNRPG
jgi:hypothetical protein